MRHIIWKCAMPNKGKICLFKSYYMPILTYGPETRTWTKADISTAMAAKMIFLRHRERKNRKREIIRNKKLRLLRVKCLRRQINKQQNNIDKF
jgi:hypothetical protein